ncbi:MAG: PHP domain-containing protein [Pseudomonadota bacterium]|nr:PHP domain-containing protein [Pseudomonadota bacterium]
MSSYSKIDLHTHSNKSDGELSPYDLVTKASDKGIQMLALTDHDTVSGLGDAKKAAVKKNISLINGVELSTQWDNKTIHIVGLNIEAENTLLIKACKKLKALRKERAKKISQKLSKVGITGAYEYTKKVAVNGNITRFHFAQFLIEQKYAENQADVFKKFLVKNKPGYISVNWPNLNETINLVNSIGGIAVIAHPLRYKITDTKLRKLIDEFKQCGGKAIEVITGRNISKEVAVASNYTKKYNLAASIGSDFHNESISWNRLGELPLLPENLVPVWELWEKNN